MAKNNRRLTEKQVARLRFYRSCEINRGYPAGNLLRDAQSEALRERGMVYVDGSVTEAGREELTRQDKLLADAEADKARRASVQAVVATGKCPLCGCTLRRNLSLTGWWQCDQLGAVGFRKDASKPSCSWQGFTS